MTSFDLSNRTRRGDPHEPPRFELEYLIDDIEDPTEVTIVPADGGDRCETEWITADIYHAVPIEWVR